MTFCRLNILIILLLGAGVVSAQSTINTAQPPCRMRALKTVEEARRNAILGNADAARKLLDQADRECGTSSEVLNRIASVYEQLGDKVMAAIYSKNARQRSETPIVVNAEGGAQARDHGYVREKYALIVGISRFQSPNIPSLKFSSKDAKDFAALLDDPSIGRFHPENVTVLTDEQATAKDIRSALSSIAAKAMKDDLVVLYFSTHGSSPSMDKSKIGTGYLVTYDTEVNDLYATAFGMDELAHFMREKLRAERIVTFLDTCFSGDTTRILRQENGSKALTVETLSDQSIGQIAQGKGSVAITSSGNRELSWESSEKQNSFFTLYLIDAIRSHHGLANIGQIYTEIQRKIPSAVRDYTRRKGLGPNGKGAEQNPGIYPNSDIPDIVIGAPPQ